MRGMFLAASLAGLATIAGSPARLNDHMPAFSASVNAGTLGELHFRGTRTGPVVFELDGVGQMVGEYFINADSSDRVIVTDVVGDRVRLESPGEWEGAGILRNSTYWGVFVYRDEARDRRNRGARGTHLGTLEPSGRLRVRGTFTNRAWPEFESSWTRLDPPTVGTVSLETLRGLPLRGEYELWPPERGRAPGPDFEHPVWPPEWFKGDQRIMLADGTDVDVWPEVTRRVEPDRESDGGQPSVTADGLVVVRALVDRHGAVIVVGIARSVPALDAAALRAVRQWRFRPAIRHGLTVPASVYVPVRFAASAATSGLAAQPESSAELRVDSFEIVKVDGLNDSFAAGARAGERWTKDPVRVAVEVLGVSARDSRSLDLRYDANRGELPDSAEVTLVVDGFLDDSVRGSWVWLRLARQRDDTWRLVEMRRAWRCWRGHHQGSYSNQPCL